MADEQCDHISKVLPQHGNLFSPYVVNCVFMSLLSLTAIVGNVLILVSICRAPQFLRQPSYFLLVNLAFADFCVGFLAEPTYLVYKISYLVDPFSVLSCYAGIIFNFLSYFLTSLSLWTAAAISLDRFLALHLHMKYYTIVTKFRVCILILVLLALSTVFASMFEWALDTQNTVFVCADSLALLIALLSYVRIFQIVRYHRRQISIQLAEVSFGHRDENDSIGTSFYGQQDNREQLNRVPFDETDENREMVNRKSSDTQTANSETQANGNGLEKKSAENRENRGRFSVTEVLGGQKQHEEQTNIMKTKDQSRNEGQQFCLGNKTVVDNTTMQLVGTKQGNHEFKSSGVDVHVTKILNQQTEKTELSEIEQESKTLAEPPVDNSEVLIKEMQTVCRELIKYNTELQGEVLGFEDEQADTGISRDKNCFLSKEHPKYNVKHALADAPTPFVMQETNRKQQNEVSSSEEDNCVKKCHQNHYQNYGLAEESSTSTEQQEADQTEVEKTEIIKSEDNNRFEVLHEIQNPTCAFADDTKPTGRQEVKYKTEAIQENSVNHGREERATNSVTTNNDQLISSTSRRRSSYGSNTTMTTISDSRITNRNSKGFKMLHFKKSVFNMFVIWFLMLLCYLPLICISTLVMFLGRSYAIHLAFNFTTSVMFVNSSINPIVFCWRIREFRAAVRKTLREVFGFAWANQTSRNDNLTSFANQ